MGDDKQRRQDQDQEDKNLSPDERQFKRTHPATWEQMQREKKEQEGRS